MAKKKSTATRRDESQAAAARAATIRKAQERKERRRRSLVVTGVGTVALALILLIGYLVQSSRDTTGESASPPRNASGYAMVVGRTSAPKTVTIYEDFLCPFCGQLEAATRGKLQAGIAAGDVRVKYHVVDFLDRSSTSEYSLRAANALAVVLDASGPAVAKKFHDLLYENQPEEGSAGISDGQLIDYAVQAGASKSEVSDGISNRSFARWVKNGTSAASKADVTQTPTVLVDGRKLSGTTIAELAQDIDKAAAG